MFLRIIGKGLLKERECIGQQFMMDIAEHGINSDELVVEFVKEFVNISSGEIELY